MADSPLGGGTPLWVGLTRHRAVGELPEIGATDAFSGSPLPRPSHPLKGPILKGSKGSSRAVASHHGNVR